MANKFKEGDRVKIVKMHLSDESLFSIGNIGTVMLVRDYYNVIYVKLDEGQDVTEAGNSTYGSLTGKDQTFVYAFNEDQLEFIFELDESYYKPGANGWIPDRLAEGIDVMQITAELVSVQVGK